jgi:hypothetical protein
MTTEELLELFQKHEDGYGERNYTPQKELMVTSRGDLNALILLDKLCPKEPTYRGMAPDIVCSAEHDQIWIDVELEDLAKVATSDHVNALVFFGMFIDSSTDSLSMFV